MLIAARWMILEQKQRLSSESLVASITTADSHSLPLLLGKISAEPSEFLPMIRAELAASRADENKWVNLSVAELAADPGATGKPLLGYLPNARPVEVPAIVDALTPRSESLRPSIWRALQSAGASDEAQLRLGCLAAQISADDERWSAIAPAVSRALVRQHPVDIGIYTAALRPARAALVPPLVALYRGPATDAIARDVAAGILARFADDQPATLADLIGDADAVSFRLLLCELQDQSAATLPRLESIANQQVSFEQLAADPSGQSKHDLNRAYDLVLRRRANVLVAMWRLGETDAGLGALGYDADPALRGWLIELLAPLGVPTDRLWALANSTANDGTRQSLLLAIGQAELATMSPIDRQGIIEGVLQIYQRNPDAGVHSACRWLLRNRLNAADSDIDRRQRSSRWCNSVPSLVRRSQCPFVYSFHPSKHVFDGFTFPRGIARRR